MALPFSCDPQGLALARTALGAFVRSPTLMLYIGPDQIMPITSVLSAIVGVALMFWSRIVGVVARAWTACTRRDRPPRMKSASENP